ncbi:FMN-binding protein [Streptomyces sp. NPDC002889]|uniref:FMN-binding protein n=1 Tax=Streptomyces sp. NPDC002889 TaxID=3364669 RepID=UPI0036B02678
MLGVAGTASAVVLLLALKQPATSVAGASSQAGGSVPPAAAGSAGSGSGAAGGQTVLGDEAETQYGPVQVQLTLSGGRITAAKAVKAPDTDANSRKIAANAVPELNQAAVTAQSAGIDAVSGATYTSQGYIESLQSAIDKAGAAGAGAGEAAAPGSGSGSGSGTGTAGSGADPGTVGSGAESGSGSGSGSEAPKTFVGDAASTQYGDVQVRITVSGGRITAADAVKAPGSDANSRKIAANAVPKLNQAAVTAQSAGIDAVSGASYTSEGYIESLQSAIDKAGL